MRIKEILSQNRRDFRAIYECEHCGYTKEDKGYDDANFHNNVIPDMICPKCGFRFSTYEIYAKDYTAPVAQIRRS